MKANKFFARQLRNAAALSLFFCALSTQAASSSNGQPIPIKVVVVTMFEAGADTGDRPGELQHWVERDTPGQDPSVSPGLHALHMNGDGVLTMLTGMGRPQSSGSIIALGLDPRFDLHKAYWIVAGITGIDPADGSLGSATWAEWVVDERLRLRIDGREKSQPIGPPASCHWVSPSPINHHAQIRGEMYHLNPTLIEWAFHLTQHVALGDTREMQKDRAAYASSNRCAVLPSC